MNDSELERTMLTARRGLAPNTEDAARVRARLDAALLAPASGRTSKPATSSGPASEVAVNASRVGRIAATLTLAALTGAGGYVLGYRTRDAELRQRGEPRVVAASPLPAASAMAPTETRPPLQPAPDLPGSKASARRTGGTSVPLDVVPAPVGSAAGESPLEIETRLLARVERSLREKNPRLALGLLAELDRQVPGGQLAEERQAGRVVAHCELGSDTAPDLARDFTARYPSSAYLARVRAACRTPSNDQARPETDSRVPGE